MRLEVRGRNRRAIALYEGEGYCRFGRIEDYYEDGAPAFRYEKALRHVQARWFVKLSRFECSASLRQGSRSVDFIRSSASNPASEALRKSGAMAKFRRWRRGAAAAPIR